MVAGEPCEVQPVLELPCHVIPFRLTWVHPKSALVPVNLATEDLTNGSRMNTLDCLNVASLVAALCSGDNSQALLLCDSGCCNNLANTIRIDRYRLFHEDVLTCFDSGLEVVRAEPWRRRQNHVVTVGCKDFLVSIPARECCVICELCTGSMLSLEATSQFLDTLWEQVTKSNNFHIWVRS